MAAAAPAPQTDWQRYFTAIMRHKWPVLIITLLGTALGVLATRLLSRDYSTKAILWVERSARDPEQPAVVSGEEVVVATPGWIQLVTSNAVMDSVVRQLRLFVTPKTAADSAALGGFEVRDQVQPGVYRLDVSADAKTFELLKEDGTVLQKGAVGEPVGEDLGFLWTPGPDVLSAGRTYEFSVAPPYEAAQDLAGSLRIRMDEGSSFLVISLRGENPSRIAGAVNAIAARTVAVAADMKRRRFEELSTILGEQYDRARVSLDTAELSLRNFRVRNAGIIGAREYTSSPRSVPTDANFALTAQKDVMERDRATIDAALRASPQAGSRVDMLSSVAAVRESPELNATLAEVARKRATLRELRQRYTDEAAPVQQLRAEIDSLEGSAVPALAGQLSTQLAAREQALAPRVAQAMGNLRRLPTLELDETRLVRDVAGAEALSNTVRQRYEAARLALASSLPDVRVLDAAMIPHRPAASLAPIIIAFAFITSLGLACFGIIVRDGVDPKVRYPEQVTQRMRLNILGAIPRVGARAMRSAEDMAPAIEALRALRLRVLHALNGSEPLMLTVTSPSVGEGKSFTSSNLALSFADAGYRTLLVDGDLRRGGLHTVLGLPPGPGLTDILAGRSSLDEALRETSNPGLSLLGCGARMHRAPELLLSRKLKDTIDSVRTQFDVIIIDSPPLAAGVDPVILGTITRNIMLVLRSGTTDLPLVTAKLEVLDSLPVRMIGAVLNDVRDGGAFKHYTYDSKDYIKALGGFASTGKEGPKILHGANADD